MAVRRIVANIETQAFDDVRSFYMELFGLEVAMDMGWIATLVSDRQARVQLSVMTEGGSGTPVPDLSIEVDDVDETYLRAESLDCPITYPLTDEPWGVRRFFLRDPAGKLINVLAHRS